MKYLTVDFGSTYTKLTAIDSQEVSILGTTSAFTTIETNIMDGYNLALQRLEEKIGKVSYAQTLCCSSAGGGLKMVALGLVPELTAKAARMAASSAGAKVIKTYAFEISKTEQEEIQTINPDLILLCGGTDGGNKEVIIANAKRLCAIEGNFSVIVAGNKSASYDLEEIFDQSDKDYVITDNVMPSFNVLNIEPAKQKIKDLFIKRIIDAKGLSKAQAMASNEVIPTPLAVMAACELLSKGTKTNEGIGEFMAVDLGGATTDIYSMASGKPSIDNVVIKGLPEAFSKRSVEGDIGMRYSLTAFEPSLDTDAFANEYKISKEEVDAWIEQCVDKPDTIAKKGSIEERIEEFIARNAVRIATDRHCGWMESAYSPLGEVFTLVGKDLTEIRYVIGIGGAIINSDHPTYILEGVKYNMANYNYMKPKQPEYMLDEIYIFASMGLLATVDEELALALMKKEIKLISKI